MCSILPLHIMITRRDFTRTSLFALGAGLAGCSQLHPFGSRDQTTNSGGFTYGKQDASEADLTIWWEQGFLPSENEIMIRIVKDWEKQSGAKVNLKFVSVDLMDQTFTELLDETNNPNLPDIVYSVGVDSSLAPKLAWRDQLMDLSEVILPIKDRYTSVALSQVHYRNQIKGERGYYAMPLWQSDDYLHYWGSLIEKIGFRQQDIPKAWSPFWRFWQTAQQELRSQGHPQIYGLGLCMSTVGFDTYTSLMMFLDAHNVSVVNDKGELLLDETSNRQGFIDALEEYTQFYRDGYIPPDAMKWTGAGNNNSFLSGDILMTQNLTLSIPLTQKLPRNAYNQDAAARYQQIVTIDRPLKPDGTELLTRKGIKQAIVPKASLHPTATKEFLSYLVEPETLNRLIQGFKGRVLPVTPKLFENSMWQDETDPHLSAALQIYNRPSLIPHEVTHSAFSEVQSQQLWAQTILKIAQEQVSSAKAADWAIDQIKTIWTQWEKPV